MVGLIPVVLGYLATIVAIYLEYKSPPDKDTILGLRRGGFVLLLFAAASMVGGVWKYAQDLREAAVLNRKEDDRDLKLTKIIDEVQSLGRATRDPEIAKQFQGIAQKLGMAYTTNPFQSGDGRFREEGPRRSTSPCTGLLTQPVRGISVTASMRHAKCSANTVVQRQGETS